MQSPWASSESEGRGGRTSGRLRDVFFFFFSRVFFSCGGVSFFPVFEKDAATRAISVKPFLSRSRSLFLPMQRHRSFQSRKRSSQSRQWAKSSWYVADSSPTGGSNSYQEKKKKKRLSRPSLMQNNISRYLSRLSPPIPNVPWHGRRGSRLQRGQGRGSVRLLREEGEQGLRGHVGSSEAKVVLIRRRRRLSLRRHGLRPAADAHSASARELRQQRAYDRRVHHVSGAHGGGTNFVFARVRAREEEGRERGSSSFGNEEEAERLAENKREVTELCSFSQSLNSPQSSLFHSLLSLLSFILSLSTLSLARSRSALPPRQSMETPTERDL